jgi:glutamine amidotransferase
VIAIVDYGAGNLTSVKKALDRLAVDSTITSDPSDISAADKVVVPGVGHFAATNRLTETGLRSAVLDAMSSGVPVLGICVGMQWLFTSSAESPTTPGLGVFSGKCDRFPAQVKSPQVGWNQLQLLGKSVLMEGVPENSFVYFTHSYRVPVVPETTAAAEYGGMFSAAVERNNVFGVQFHPEKSSVAGLRILSNFCGIQRC